MPGALMQLVAYGAQDVYLTGNPQMTYWKVVYRRCTSFAMESIEQVFNGQGDFGSYVQCVVGRNGDLIHNTFLVVTLPEIDCCWSMPPCYTGDDGGGVAADNVRAERIAWILGPRGKDANWARWIDYPGENLIDYVEVDIGGTIIDRQYGEWMHIWNQLTLTNEKREGYNKMIGHTTELTYLTMGRAPANSKCVCCKQQCEGCLGPCNTCAFRCNLPETTLYIPLLFWFCRNPGLALPLIALQYHEVKINVQLRDLECVLWAVDSLSDGGDPKLVGSGAPPLLLPKACGTMMQAVAGSTVTIPTGMVAGHPPYGILLANDVPGIASRNHGDGAYTKHLVTCSLFIDYIFLDRDERRYMAQNPHEYLIEQVQFSDNVSTSVSENSLELDFNHPCKEIFLTTQQEYFRDCCKQFEACEPLYKALGIQPFNYTDCLDAMPPAYHAFHGPDVGTDDSLSIYNFLVADVGGDTINCIADASNSHFGTHIIHNGLFRNPGAATHLHRHADQLRLDVEAAPPPNHVNVPSLHAIDQATWWTPEGYANGWMDENHTFSTISSATDPSGSFAPLSSIQNSLVSDAGAIVLANAALNMHCWGKNPVYSLVLQLNGQDRFSQRSGRWFDEIQPFKYHTHQPDTGINLYSFALHPEKHNPSGTLNFSRIDNAVLRFTLTSFMFNTNNNAVNLKVYATNYNVLRIMSGMGGLAYSN